jgi:hypothetical protein
MIMGVFDWLKQVLEQQQDESCETTPEAKKFITDYDNQVETAKQSLRERQTKDREERSASKGDR